MRLQPVQSDVLLESPVPVRQVAQLHRLHDALDDEGLASAHDRRGGERRPGGNLARCFLAGGENLHVSPADVDDQHAHGETQLALASSALLPAITPMSSCQELTNDFAPSS